MVFGAKERRVSWSYTWAAGWMVEIFIETTLKEELVWEKKEGDRCIQFVASVGHLCDYG